MNTFPNKPFADHLSFTKDMMWIFLKDGRQLGVPLAYFPRLMHASQKQLECYEMSGGGSGLHWDALDEDICVDNLLLGIYDRTQNFSDAA
ncbi:MAG: DUF2442 domain-containing protein [Gammaproteobacteria bacterium]|nr:DUF2442 domain-containing protein [Gammaproteobacteria bacterium]